MVSMDADGLLMIAQLCSQLPHPPPDVIHGRAKCSRNEKRGKQKWDVRLPPFAPPARLLRLKEDCLRPVAVQSRPELDRDAGGHPELGGAVRAGREEVALRPDLGRRCPLLLGAGELPLASLAVCAPRPFGC